MSETPMVSMVYDITNDIFNSSGFELPSIGYEINKKNFYDEFQDMNRFYDGTDLEDHNVFEDLFGFSI